MISVIIPTYNEQYHIKRLLESLVNVKDEEIEVIVVDGGSIDDTVRLVRDVASVKLIQSEKGRARQMNVGWKVSKGEYLFFLHADSILIDDWYDAILSVFDHSKCIAGSFYLQFDQKGFWYDLYSNISKRKGSLTTFGDQGLFVRREVFPELGGYSDLPILEDYDMIKRLYELGEVVKLDCPIITSARKFQKNGVVYQQLKNISIVLLYNIGVSPERLARWYNR